MISIMVFLAIDSMLAFAPPMSVTVCGGAKGSVKMDGADVVISGILVFGQHSAHITAEGESMNNTSCAIFTVFPGTPGFLIPGVDESEVSSDAKVKRFSMEYKEYLERHPREHKKVRIRGILKVKRGFRSSPGNGFGHKGVFRTALLVRDVEFVQ